MLVATGDASAGAPSQDLVPLTGEAMRGPFAKLSAACADCSASMTAPERRVVPKPAAPFLEVRVIVSGDLKEKPSYSTPRRHYLAARLASGWWLHEIGYAAAATGRNESTRMVSEQRLETADVLPGGGAEILVETKETTHSGGRVRSQIDDRHLHICGVGTSGRPSCTEVHTYRFVGHMADSWDTTVSFLKDGTVVQAGEAGSSHFERIYVVRFP